MNRYRGTRLAALVCVGCVALLSGCTTGSTPSPDPVRSSATPGPTVTSTVAPDAAARLAERYRQSGGTEEVSGILRDSGPDGVPLLVVWQNSPDSDARAFETLKNSVVAFLRDEEELPLGNGYLMDVFGPDGRLQHRLDARP